MILGDEDICKDVLIQLRASFQHEHRDPYRSRIPYPGQTGNLLRHRKLRRPATTSGHMHMRIYMHNQDRAYGGNGPPPRPNSCYKNNDQELGLNWNAGSIELQCQSPTFSISYALPRGCLKYCACTQGEPVFRGVLSQ